MKQFLLVLFVLTSALLYGQTFQKVDSAFMQTLEPGSFEYVNISVEDNLVIEKKSDILIDFSSMDIPAKLDSVCVSVGKKTYKMNLLTPFMVKGIDVSMKVEMRMYKDGKPLDFETSNVDGRSLEIERRNRPTFTSDTVVFGFLALILALIFYTAHKQTKFWKSFYRIVPALLLCYLIPAVLDLFGLISKDYSSLYGMAKDYLLPGALILMTLGIDIKGIFNLGPKAIIMFLTATVGIIIGGPIAIFIYSWIDPSVVGGIGNDAAWRGFSTLAGSWIGGGANQAAMLETYRYNPDLYGKMVTVDIVVANLWMAFLLWAAARAEKFDRWLKADTSSIEDLKKRVSDYEASTARIPSLTDYMVMLGITFSVVAVGHFGGIELAALFDPESPFGSSFFWLVVIATTGGLLLSLTKLRSYEGAGALKLGSVFIYILVATIGMKMELAEAVKEPELILVGIIWMLVHVIILFIVAKLIKAPFFFVAVGSKANVGGAASAPIVAAAFHPSLASVGALLAVLGYALGTYGAILSAELMRMVAP